MPLPDPCRSPRRDPSGRRCCNRTRPRPRRCFRAASRVFGAETVRELDAGLRAHLLKTNGGRGRLPAGRRQEQGRTPKTSHLDLTSAVSRPWTGRSILAGSVPLSRIPGTALSGARPGPAWHPTQTRCSPRRAQNQPFSAVTVFPAGPATRTGCRDRRAPARKTTIPLDGGLAESYGDPVPSSAHTRTAVTESAGIGERDV